MPDPGGILNGRRVLIVEDQFLIADDMARAVAALGGETVGPCANVEAARKRLQTEAPDCAVLDVNLHGENVFSLAEELTRMKVPFAFATGYDSGMIPAAFQACPRIEKPVSPTALQEALAALKLGR